MNQKEKKLAAESCGLKSYERLNFVDWHKSDVTNLVLTALRAPVTSKQTLLILRWDLANFFVL